MPSISQGEWQPLHFAPLPTSPGRRGITAGPGAFVLAGAVIGIIGWCQPATAAACRVPAAVLCEGCVERLSIRITPGGECRISFSSPASPGSAEAGKFVDIDVEAGSPRPAHRRAGAPHLSDARPAAWPHPAARCFVFNGRRFCE